MLFIVEGRRFERIGYPFFRLNKGKNIAMKAENRLKVAMRLQLYKIVLLYLQRSI